MTDESARFESTDALIERMKEDDFRDAHENATKMSPREYAKLRNRTPQSVYYHLRQGNLVWDTCECGRRVIVVAEADELFGYTSKEVEDVDKQA